MDFRRIPFLVLFLFLFTACEDEAKSRIVVRLTDSPGDFTRVNIDIKNIEVLGENGWEALPNVNEGVYNLLDFTGGRETILASTEYSPGKISQIRLILGPDNSVEVNKERHPLETPSAKQSGLKLSLNAEVTPGQTYSMLLDFDAAKSIVVTGRGTYILKPVIKVVTESQDGAIEGKVAPANLNVAVFAISGKDTLGTGYLRPGAGDFFVGGLPAGTYKLSLDPGELSRHYPITKENIVVSLGEVTSVGTTDLPSK